MALAAWCCGRTFTGLPFWPLGHLPVVTLLQNTPISQMSKFLSIPTLPELAPKTTAGLNELQDKLSQVQLNHDAFLSTPTVTTADGYRKSLVKLSEFVAKDYLPLVNTINSTLNQAVQNGSVTGAFDLSGISG